MKKIVVGLIFLFILPLCASEQPFDAIIPLGRDCQIPHQMRVNGLRKVSLPLDWLITPYESLLHVMENKFEGFMTPENFELVVKGESKYILDKKYGIRIIHGFRLEEDFLKDFDELAPAFERRVQRLFSLIQESKRILFIRKELQKEQAADLRDFLKKIFPEKNFTLAVLDGTNEIKEDWNLEGIRNFYLRQPEPYTWKGDTGAYQEIFTALGLSLGTREDSTLEI